MDKAVINQLPIENLRGRRVFVRIDADAEEPANGNRVSDDKLRTILPTLDYLGSIGARVVLGTHLGNPYGNPVATLRLDPLAEALSRLTGKPVRKLDEAVGNSVLSAVIDMRDGDIVLLENLRFYPGEDANDGHFAHQLAELCEVYCDDAFAIAHRGRASTVAITRHVRPSTAGLALARELTLFEAVLEQCESPFVALIAGARLEEKLPVLENLVPKVNRLMLGGLLALAFLKAQGREIGAASVDRGLMPLAEEFLEQAEKKVELILPEDFVVVHAGLFKLFEKSGRQTPLPEARQALVNEITPTDLPVDIGPRTVRRIKQLLDGARTFFWNGPVGMWEIEPFAAGTRAVAQALVEEAPQRRHRSVVCGDSLARALRSFDLSFERIRHLSSGGASALAMLAGKPLPAVAALDNEIDLHAPVEKRPGKILLAVDGSAPSIEAARKISTLVAAEGAEIALVYVQKPSERDAEIPLMDSATQRRRDLERRLEAERVMAAGQAPLARQGLVAHHRIIASGDPADEILKVADELGVQLLAMGSHGRTGILGIFLGSVSRKVLDRAHCPVLIVHPPGLATDADADG
jgi:phosphoglycerate kinase